ncbi:MAG: glycoside hydrolase family 3 N-terminal domain-containing protein, partial [Acidimicrobiales bacterium]
MADHLPAAVLAGLVVERMTLSEKLGEVVLRHSGLYENVDSGVARLCIPSLTLQDGPDGLAFGDSGVTQLPAPLGLAASFDPHLARQYGRLLGEEAAGQGVDVVQGPDLNIDRVPQDGRGFEGFGEDALLTSAMGDAEIEGIQSQGVMADAKHFAIYNQEANRGTLDTVVPARALQEIYLAPFRSAVKAGVASVMCAYPRLDGTFQCQDPALAQILSQWGFVGFVRSDEGAAHNLGAALDAGTDLLKPGSVRELEAVVAKGALAVSTVSEAVERLLTLMFEYGLVGRPLQGVPGAKVDSAGHASVALRVAERSAVLLKNSHGTLPLEPSALRSVAVIGAAASDDPVTAGHGSSHVAAPFTITPLEAIRAHLAKTATVVYHDGASSTARLPLIPPADLTPLSGRGHGLTFTVGHLSGASGVVSMVVPATEVSVRNQAPRQVKAPPVESNPLPVRERGSSAAASGGPPVGVRVRGSQIVLPPRWGPSTVAWSGTLAVPRSGLYTFSLTGSGSATLSLDGRVALDDSVVHGSGTWSSAIDLTGGRHYRLRLSWMPLDNRNGTESTLAVGMTYDSAAIEAAAEAARSAQVAVVVAAAESGETFDRPSL